MGCHSPAAPVVLCCAVLAIHWHDNGGQATKVTQQESSAVNRAWMMCIDEALINSG